MSWRELFWGWRGRINRLQFVVGVLSFSLVITAIAYNAWPFPVLNDGGEIVWEASAGWIIHCLVLVIYAPAISSLLIRRLHDIGWTGWWAVTSLVAGQIASQMMFFWPDLHWLRILVGLPVAVAALTGFLALSQEGANRFGPQPASGLPKRW